MPKGARKNHADFSLSTIPEASAIQRPRPTWHFVNANKLPVAHIHPGHAEIIPNCRTDIDAGVAISVGTRSFVSEDILPMVGGARVLPAATASAYQIVE